MSKPRLETLRAEVKAAWVKACEADGVDPSAKFVIFSDSPEAREYNAAISRYFQAVR